MTKPKINFWWSQQPFRLELKGYEGNCKDCYKKTQNKLLTIALEKPSMFDFSIRMTEKYQKYRSYQQREGKSREELNMPVNFFRDNMTPQELIALAQSKDFTRSHNDADVYDFEGVDDDFNSCSESCEVEW